jgi:Sigma-70, region 4
MAPMDSLPADQRAVLQLVLQRGRSYDEIARLLSIDRGAVRKRALDALDALGPQTGVSPARRAVIADYLLGQLPEPVGEQTRAQLAESAAERAWAQGVLAEVAPLASAPLPEVPVEAQPVLAPPPPGSSPAPNELPPEPPTPKQRQSSRLGGIVLLGGAAVVVLIVVIVLIVSSGSSSNKPSSSAQASSSTTPAAGVSTSTTSSTTAKVVAQINLLPPTPGGKTAGIAEVLNEGAADGIAIVAQNVPPNAIHPPNAYAVWLYNSPTDAHILGFVNPGVGKTGRLSTAGALPSNASHFKRLIITVEMVASPKSPGKIILQGALTGL